MIQDLIIRAVLKQLMKALITRVPLLGWGPLPIIISFFAEKLIRILVEKTVLGLNFLYIDIRTELELKKYNSRMAEIEAELIKQDGDLDLDKFDKMVSDAAIDFYRIG